MRDVGHGRQGEEPTRQPPLTILRAMQMIAILPIGTSALSDRFVTAAIFAEHVA